MNTSFLTIPRMFFRLFILFSLILQCYSTDDTCYSNVAIPHNSSILPYYLLNHTVADCLPQYNKYVAEQPEPTLCPAGLLNLYVTPQAVFIKDHVPHVQTNVSIVVHEPVSALFIRLQCVYAPSQDDVYCHSNASMVKNGIWTWPCRGITLKDELIEFPLRYGYSCFRMFGLSQHMLNVTVFPQNCVASILFSIPSETQIFPKIADFYHRPSGQQKETVDPKWSPMVAVEMKEDDGVWIRVEGPPAVKVRYYNISLFKRSTNGIKLHKSFEVYPPHTGVKWKDAVNGNYEIYAYVPRHDCHLICEPKQENCSPCLHTHLNFTLFDDRRSVAWNIQHLYVESNSHTFLVFALVSILIAAMVVAGFLVLKRYKVIYRRAEEHSLRKIPKVLLIYSDDCEQHSKCVLTFSHLLRSAARVNVVLDEEDLVLQGAMPSRWLIDQLHSSDFVFIVVSPCTNTILEGRKLIKRRPFRDLFATAVDMIITDIGQHGRSVKSRYAIIRLPYSPKTMPYQLDVLGLRKFSFPTDISQVAAFLHRLKGGRVDNVTMDQALLSDFNTHVSAMQNMMEQNRNWMELRIAPVSQVTESSEMKPIVPTKNLTPKTHEEIVKEAVERGLEPPSDTEDEDLHGSERVQPTIQLLPMSDTESEDSN